jgi:protein-disulfide isomerase
MSSRSRRGISWELIGLLTLAILVAAGGIRWYRSSERQGEVQPPTHVTVDPAAGVATGVTSDGRPTLGRPDAPVTIVEFADFQCPFCRDFVLGEFAGIVRDYIVPGKVRLEWVALDFDGAESTDAAEAALCALEQGRFWEMHDWLYANQSPLSNRGAFARERLLAMATGAGADSADVAACMDDPSTADRIAANDAFARSQSVNSTPNFLVGDRLVEGADAVVLRRVIDDALRR